MKKVVASFLVLTLCLSVVSAFSLCDLFPFFCKDKSITGMAFAIDEPCSSEGDHACAADGDTQLYCPADLEWQFSQYCSTTDRTCEDGYCRAICGDGTCGLYESYSNCEGTYPIDCPIESEDDYCSNDFDDDWDGDVDCDDSDCAYTITCIVCTDSDGGIDYYTPGVATGIYAGGISSMHFIYGDGEVQQLDGPGETIYYDHCGDSVQLNEAFCGSDGRLGSIANMCPNGCEDGACIEDSQSDQTICINSGGYWYDSNCHTSPQNLMCDSYHLYLCVETNCTSAGGYWYSSTCNSDSQGTTPPTNQTTTNNETNTTTPPTNQTTTTTQTDQTTEDQITPDQTIVPDQTDPIIVAEQTAIINEINQVNEENEASSLGNGTPCLGCFYDDYCLPIGIRNEINEINVYCNISGDFELQKIENGFCNNHYECRSNFCTNDECVSQGFLIKIINWFRNLFGVFDSSGDELNETIESNQTSVTAPTNQTTPSNETPSNQTS